MAAPGSSEWRKTHWPTCEKAKLKTGRFGPQQIKLHVAAEAFEAVNALFNIMASHGYVVRDKVTGAYNCRKITNGSVPSAHASGIAVDVNWDANPYVKAKLVTDMPRAMIDQICALKTRSGAKVWRWGGDWDGRPETTHAFYDAMHFEIIATPEELRAGISQAVPTPGTVPSKMPLLRKGAAGAAVVKLQELLTRTGHSVPNSGQFLQQTDTAVRAYQRSRGLKPDGLVGPATWTALLNDLPPLEKGDPPPGKAPVALR